MGAGLLGFIIIQDIMRELRLIGLDVCWLFHQIVQVPG